MKNQVKSGKAGSSLIHKFGSVTFGMTFFVMALSLQVSHTQNVFWLAGQPADQPAPADPTSYVAWWLALVASIALDGATLWFIAVGFRIASYGFAVFSILMNVGYYDYLKYDMSNWQENWIHWIASIGIPILIVLYAHQVKHMIDEDENPASVSSSQPPEAVPWWANKLADLWVKYPRFRPVIEKFVGWEFQLDQKPSTALQLTDSDDVQPITVEPVKPTVQRPMQRPAATRNGQLDQTDQAILDFLELNGPATTSVIANTVGLTQAGVYRPASNSTPEKGRLVKLRNLGKIARSGDVWRLA